MVSNSALRGNFDQVIFVGGNETVARKSGSDARTEIGVIRNSTMEGNITRGIRVLDATTVSQSYFADATTRIGTVRDATVSGDFDQSIYIGEVVTVARHVDKTALTCVGTIRYGSHEDGPSSNLSYIRSRTQSGSIGPISTGSIGASSSRNRVDSRGC